ncbi:hypothetical protein C1J03_04200 [Sulfitobacter sp. SK012]|uniref:DUF6173 family protein n=1 Tax=Sulfitobacter sp. SK012 TaxID=1389005 RepID=UPI000E0A8395|nr:DUF6173 family protein [Sulfitobacter sp. SK012]AXI45308.1 hypothetical protein C1J03_04200 [Sulfitobacter sp. SK012]
MTDQIKTAAEAFEADALPRVHEVHTDPDKANASNVKVPNAVANTPVKSKSPAQWAYERVVLYLKKFEEELDEDHEVAMGFTGADAGVLRIEGMGYFDPDVLTFYGTDPAGGRMQLVQHVSQLNVVLRALPKAVQEDAPRRIGFQLVEDLEQDAKTS